MCLKAPQEIPMYSQGSEARVAPADAAVFSLAFLCYLPYAARMTFL